MFIEDHGVIGDLHTVALVNLQASINFMCFPRIDGASVFAALLEPTAGAFSIGLPPGERRYRQLYVPDTNVLMTRILSAEEVIEVLDFMIVGQEVQEPIIVRRLSAVRGRTRVTIRCKPAFNYARMPHRARLHEGGVLFTPDEGGIELALLGTAELRVDGGAAVAEFELAPGAFVDFVLGAPCRRLPKTPQAVSEFAADQYARCVHLWRSWTARSTYRGRYREVVMRSALVLKLLVSAQHGSIAAAATFGLPEAAQGERNWDYRFSWIRDASFAVYAFIRLGYVDEAIAFMGWLGRCFDQKGETGPLQPLYRMDGSTDIDEATLDHFNGFEGARPVRIGNAAAKQLQLDIYGACMDAVYLTSKYGGALPLDGWRKVSTIVDWVCQNWERPDEGIWEQRNGREPLLHSRLMCWVAVDRAVRLAQKRSLPGSLAEWSRVRSAIHHSIVTDFWNEELQAFVRAQGSDEVDASTLMMPLVRFIGARDPQWRSTQALIEKQLAEDGLIFRYRPGNAIDGLPGYEGAFIPCSFWMVECLARQGEAARAQLMFEKILSYGNHLQLFAEEIGPNGAQMGNFPQALTHLALISSACALDRALSGDRSETWS